MGRSSPEHHTPTPWDVILAVRRFQHILQAHLDRCLQGFGLSFAQYQILEILAAEPKLHAGELGRRLRITRQTAHGLLAQLARADLVELLPKDGAIRGAWLTRLGRRRLAQCRRAVDGTERAFAALPAGTRSDLLEGLIACEAAIAPRPEPRWPQ